MQGWIASPFSYSFLDLHLREVSLSCILEQIQVHLWYRCRLWVVRQYQLEIVVEELLDGLRRALRCRLIFPCWSERATRIGGIGELKSPQNVHGLRIGWMCGPDFEIGAELMHVVSLLVSLAVYLSLPIMIQYQNLSTLLLSCCCQKERQE